MGDRLDQGALDDEELELRAWGGSVVGPPYAHVLATEVDGELALYDSKREEVHLLNSTAGDIWRLLDGARCLDDVVALVAAAQSAELDEVRPHVERTVSLFIERGLVPVVSSD